MNVCKRWVSHGFLGRDSSPGHYCGQPIHLDDVCRVHWAEDERAKQEFRDMMDRATRHLPRTSVSGKGSWCGCGKFVKHTENHPWGLSSKLEDHMADEGLVPCPKCCYRFKMTGINVTCVFCEDGWVPA